MKFIIIVFTTLFINACGGSKSAVTNTVKDEVNSSIDKNTATQNSDMVIEYVENTRGYYKMVKITPELVSSKFKHDGKVETKPCDKPYWEGLMKEIENINVKEIPNLEAPSNTHRYDAKPMAYLKITKGSETYESVFFDAGNPHEKLASLIDEILTAVENKD